MESKQKSGTMEHIEIGDKDKMKEHDDKFSAMIYPVLNSGEKAQAINEELKPYLNRTVDIMTADAVLESVTKKHGIEIELKSDSKNSKVFLIDDRFLSIRFGILSNSNQDPVYKGFVDNDNDKCGIIEKINKTESAILSSEFHSNAEKKQARYNLENLIPALEQIKQVRLSKMVENANNGVLHEMTEIEKTEKVVSPSEYYRNKNLKRLEAIDKNIPDDMKKEPNWCAFKTYYNAETGKKRKVILSAQTSEWAKCNDPTTWSDYATAMEFAKAKNCEGLSFALESKNRIACIDLDHCINEKGMRSELCWDMLNASKGTYAEKSVSGTGMHIFFKGDNVLDGLNKHIENKGLECYDTAKFMSVTGNIVSKTNSLIECPEALKTKLTAELGSTQKSTRQAVSATPTNLTEHELIEKISKSKVGKDFDDMFRNGTDLCGDLSRTDAKLMSMLSFFTGQDSAMMKSIFEQSALYRPDKKNGYIDRTIDFVNANQTKSYTPPSQRANNNFKSKTK